MKKIYRRVQQVFVLGVVFVVMSGLCTQTVDAQGRTKKMSSGVNFGAARFADGDLGIGFSGRVFLEYAPYIPEIALRLSGGYFRFADTVTIGSGVIVSREEIIFEDLYATGGLIYRYSRGKIAPFLTANLGVYRYRKEDASPAGIGPVIGGSQTSPYTSIELKVGNDFGFNIGGGLEYAMGDRTKLSLEMLVHSIHGEIDDQIVDCTVMFRFLPQKR